MKKYVRILYEEMRERKKKQRMVARKVWLSLQIRYALRSIMILTLRQRLGARKVRVIGNFDKRDCSNWAMFIFI